MDAELLKRLSQITDEEKRILNVGNIDMRHYSNGLFCSGPDFDVTFGLMHTIEKSAEIYMKVLSSGQPVLQTITDEQLLSVQEDFGVTLNKEFFK